MNLLCIGPERNRLQDKLKDVDWEVLADELNLTGQKASIRGTCNHEHDPVTCYMREVISRFIQAQPPQICKKTVEKIVKALENLGDRYVREYSELKTVFSLIGEYT